ncbi:MAG: hypothetical protein IPP32_03060 [Bacteroidetes bacterium]|nr:hypothetical protein [Bacteroidota bacterium]
MKRLVLALLLFVALPRISQAQLYDSLKASLHLKRTIHFKFDSRNSFISSRRAQVWGVKLGADFGKKLRLGFGYNFLNSNFTNTLYNLSPFGLDTLERRLKIRYGCAYIEYVFYRQGHWEFSVPVQFSVGSIWYNYSFKGIEDLRSRKHLLVMYEPTLSGQYKVFDWFGLGADLGFRYALIKSRKIDDKLTSPVYVFKVLIYWGVLYKKAFPNHPIEEVKKKLF